MLGTRDRIPANRMMEIPLPIPNSVTCSPIHITKEEPAMKEIMMTSAAHTPVLVRMLALLHQGVVAPALQDGDGHRGVTGDGLRSSSCPPRRPHVARRSRARNGNGEQLDDDGAVDIGLHAQCKHCGAWRRQPPDMAFIQAQHRWCRIWAQVSRPAAFVST